MLGVLKMDINTCISKYLDMMPRIFPEEGFIAGSKIRKIFKGIKGFERIDAASPEYRYQSHGRREARPG